MADHVTADSPSSRPSVFIFDFDGIITNLKVNWRKAELEVKEKFGIEITSFLSFFEENFDNEKFKLVSDYIMQLEIEAAKSAEPFPDVVLALEKLRSIGMRCYIASMQSQKALDLFLTRNNLQFFFVDTLTRDRTGSKRRELEMVAELEKEISRKNIIFIDDSRRHMIAGEELGFRCVLFDRRKEKRTLSELVSLLI